LTYAEGLRGLLPPMYAAGLVDLVRRHPGLRQSETVAATNPMEAEKHFADGLNFYFDRDYVSAEKAFQSAVANDSQDARYYYYLGLTRLALNERGRALADLDQGGMLEALNKPAPAVVSASLERVQGPVRQLVNEIRNKPR
jgi:hypothetical protein